MDLIKWQLNFGSCNFGLKSYFDFEITRMISDQILLHSVMLRLLIDLSSNVLFWSPTWLLSILKRADLKHVDHEEVLGLE